jgi:apolipoprotein N-acyltransferase
VIALHPYDALILALVVQATQWFTALLFFWRLRRDAKAPPPTYAPAAIIIVPCKGAAAEFQDNIGAFLDQQYNGSLTRIFVVPSKQDAAYRELKKLGVEPLVTDRLPSTSSGKITDLLFALDHLPESGDVLLFADADVRVRRDWAAQLVAPLQDSKVGVSTAAMIYVPTTRGWANMVRSSWLMTGAMYTLFMGNPTGQSMALRRKDFFEQGFPETWRTSLLEDLATGLVIRAWGARVHFASRAMPISVEDSSMRFVTSVFTRWLRCIRFDDWRTWTLAVPLMAVKSGVVITTLIRPECWGLGLLYWLAEFLFFAFVAWSYSRYLPDRFSKLHGSRKPLWLWAGLSAPWVAAMQWFNVAAAAWSREVRWGGWRYRCEGPGRVTVLGRSDIPPEPIAKDRLGAAVLSSLWLAAGFLFPSWGWLIWVALVPLFWVTQDDDAYGAFFWGWGVGVGAFLLGFAWFLPTVIRLFKGAPLDAVVAFLVLFSVHGLFFGILTWTMRHISGWLAQMTGAPRDGGPALIAIPLLVVLEGWFPQFLPVRWADSQMAFLPVVQIVEMTGAAGVAALIAFVNVGLYMGTRGVRAWLIGEPVGRRMRWMLGALFFALLNVYWGKARIKQVDAIVDRQLAHGYGREVAVLQGALPLAEKFKTAQVAEHLKVYRGLTRAALAKGPLDLIVWPQGTYEPLLYFYGPGFNGASLRIGRKSYSERVRQDVPLEAPVLLSGLTVMQMPPVGNKRPRRRWYYGAHLAYGDGTFRGLTTKRERTPFSEYVPFGRLPFMRRFRARNYVPLWRGPQNVLHGPRELRLGTYMCFEEVRPQTPRHLVRNGANLLAPISSDQQFGAGRGSELHLRFSAMRAIETRRYLLRAVTSGVSAVIDPVGRIVERLEFGNRGFLRTRVVLMDEQTLFLKVGRGGYYGALFVLFFVLLAVRGRRPA